NGGTANGGHDTTTGTFVVTVNAIPPVAGDDAYDTTLGTTLDVTNPALGLLANDADANGSPLSVTPFSGATRQGGSVTVASDGTFHYTPALLFLGTDSFTYQVSDGLALTSSATVTISVTALPASLHTLYLQTSGLSSDVWALNTSAPGNVAPVP